MTPTCNDPVAAPPEGRWLWRRLFVFLSAAGLHHLLARAIDRAGPDVAARAADGLLILIGLTTVVYLVAPSAQQLGALMADLRLGARR